MLKGLGGLGDMGKMMKAAQEMQQKMADLQSELENIIVEGEAGAGLVKATATAKGQLKRLDIDPKVLSPDDKEMAEDLILAAINDVQERAQARSKAEMRKLTEELGLPPEMMDKLPGM